MIECEYCGKISKDKTALKLHYKGAKCIQKQIEKLGKPLHEEALKKIEDKKTKKEEKKEESEEEDPDQEIPFSDSSEEDSKSELDISSDEEEEEPVKSKFSSAKLFKNRNTEIKEVPPQPQRQTPTPIAKLQDIVSQRMALINNKQETVIKPQVQEEPKIIIKPQEININGVAPIEQQTKPVPIQQISNNKEVEAKLSLILNTLSSKDNKAVEEIKKMKEEIKQEQLKTVEEIKKLKEEFKQEKLKGTEEIKKLREEMTKRDESILTSISKVEEIVKEFDPLSMVEIIKKIQAELESKDDLMQIFKEDLDDTFDRFSELYKKLKDVRYDIEDIVKLNKFKK